MIHSPIFQVFKFDKILYGNNINFSPSSPKSRTDMISFLDEMDKMLVRAVESVSGPGKIYNNQGQIKEQNYAGTFIDVKI